MTVFYFIIYALVLKTSSCIEAKCSGNLQTAIENDS